MKPRHTAFTLVELLVVISIIVLLIAVLLPALQSARKAAQGVKSLTQIRQQGFALHMYAQDNKLHLPFTRARSAAQVASGVFTSNPQGAYWGSTLYFGNYLPSVDVFFSPGHEPCPTFQNRALLSTVKEWWDWRRIDYSSNYNGAMGNETSALSRTFRIDSAVPPASNHLLVIEYVRAGDFNLPSGHGYFSFNGAVNRVYMDGHGASLKGNDMGWDGIDGFEGSIIPNPIAPYYQQTRAPWYRMGFEYMW